MFGKIQSIDNSIIEHISKIHKPALNKIMITASRICNFGLVWWGLCILFVSRPKWRMVGLNIVLGIAIAHLMGEIIIKHVVKRVRPCHHLEDNEQIINRPKYYSFPSGHATASFSVVGVALLRCDTGVLLPIILLASLIAFSRLYLRVHYLTDVVAGVLLGLTSGMCSVFLFNTIVQTIV